MASHIYSTLAGATVLGVEGPGKYKTIIILEEALCGGKEGRYKTGLRNAEWGGENLSKL